MQNNKDTQKALKDLIAVIEANIHTVSFGQIYHRSDPAVKCFALVAPGHPLAGVVASLAGASLTNQLIAEMVSLIPTKDDLLAACEDDAQPSSYMLALRDYLNLRVVDKVRAIYLPPLHFIQFIHQPHGF